MNYWEECISEAFEDAGINATKAQIDTVTSWVEQENEMNMTGSWYSPQYSGEGLAVFENPDGKGGIVAYFYSYNIGRQMWLIATGKRAGNIAVLKANITSGGDIGSIDDLANVEETLWGTITLTMVGTGLHVEFAIHRGGQPWSYTMQSIFDPVTAPAPTPVPIPEPVPPPAPTPSGALLKFEINQGENWYDTGYLVLWGTDKVPEPNINGWHFRAKFTVLEGGPLTISKTITSGPHNPKMTGIAEGRVFQNGEGAVLDFYMGPQTINKSSGWEMTNFEVFAEEVPTSELPGMKPGQIVKFSAQVVYS